MSERLNELITQRAIWLEKNTKFCRELIDTIIEFGAQAEVPNVYKYSTKLYTFMHEKNGVTVQYSVYEISGYYNQRRGGYDHKLTLIVYVDGNLAVRRTFVNDEPASIETDKDQVFVPGKWVEQSMLIIKEYRVVKNNYENIADKAKIRELESILLIGIDGFGFVPNQV